MSPAKKKSGTKSATGRPSPQKNVDTEKSGPKAPSRAKARPARVYRERQISLFFISICLLQTCFLAAVLYGLVSLRIPDIRSVAHYTPPQATVIYDRYGAVADRVFVENRTVIPLERMSPFLPSAFVSAEDGRFFEHPGLDLISVLRAAVNNLRSGERSQGGSTITQQVAKSLLLSPEKTYTRKFREAILAWKIDKLLTKEEILYIYLNQIYLGEGAHGVEAAAQVYFGKSADRLTLGECALLAGLPQAPSRYSLFDHLDRAVERQKYVLNRMAADGVVSVSAARLAYSEKIRLNRQGSNRAGGDGVNGYYLQLVKKQARSIVDMDLQSAGVSVYTHLDPGMNSIGLQALRSGVEASAKRQAGRKTGAVAPPQGAFVCIETSGGEVRALLGGTSFQESPFDRATQARRPAGSTFKPLLFGAALEQGWTPASYIFDGPLSVGGKGGNSWSPKNYSEKYYGRTTLSFALAHSLNTAAVRLMQATGYKKVHELARKAGITASLPPDLSLALGAADVSLIEMTAAYLPFSGDGSYRAPSFIEKIILADGTTVYPDKKRQNIVVLSKEKNRQMRTMLAEVVRTGTARQVADAPGVQGGKTGTSDENRDAWFVGYTGKYTAGVWLGYDRNESLGRTESGGTAAAPIWRSFMLGLKE